MSNLMHNSMMVSQSIQDSLETAGRLVDCSLSLDWNYSDLSDLLQVLKHDKPTVSGLHEFEYPSLSDAQLGLGGLTELDSVKKVPLPAELVEQFGHMQCNCNMGVFPEITRAWLTIDNDIFVWNYEDGGDLAYFDGLSETILCAGLVRPRPGVFQPHILFLLCLATPVDIVLLGVSFHKTNEGDLDDFSSAEMHLLPEPLFSIPTDNTHFLQIIGSDNGRIFMTGKDGCLYEFAYQADDGWFSRKCRKINHSTSRLAFLIPSFLTSFVEEDPLVQISIDNSRNILYTRSEKGTIQVFDLGEDGRGMVQVAAVSLQTTVQNAALIARTIDRSNLKPLVHIQALTKSESINIHLVAVTHTGVRFYFTTNAFGDIKKRPSMLSLVHVRLPPGFTVTASTQRLSNVNAALYRRGTLLLTCSQGDESDVLWIINPDSFPFHPKLMETFATKGIDGKTWAVAEVPTLAFSPSKEETARPGMPFKALPPLVVTQHMEPVRRYVILTSQGSILIRKLQPVDQLRDLLVRCGGPDCSEVKAFFKLHREEQACATCLILACSSMSTDRQISEWATRAFFLYGGEPEVTSIGTMMGQGGHVSTVGPSAQGFKPYQVSTPYSNPHTPQQTFQGSGLPAQASQPYGQEVKFSGKHNGLYLYMARILRQVWERKMAVDVPIPARPGQPPFLGSTFRSEELSWYLEQLKALRDFMDKNSQFQSMVLSESFTPGYGMSQRMMGMHHDYGQIDEQLTRRYQAEAQTQEKMSLQHLQQLLNKACEVLGLWKIFCDHQFHAIAAGLTKDQQIHLCSLTFRSLVITGNEICGALITCLINSYVGDNATTDAVSSRLREICPSLYSSEDAICSKANEMLQASKYIQNKMEKDKMLNETLQFYKQITPQLDLPRVCTQFATQRYYEGIVDLSLTAAARRDPQGLALHYYKNGEPPEDGQGMQAFVTRMDCYKCITEMIHYLLTTSMSHPQAPSIPRLPGPPPAPDPNRLTNAEAQQYTEQVLRIALKCDDEMFHVALYDWLVTMDLTEKLLEIQSPYLEPYLKRANSIQPESLAALDLLWRYYEKSRNYSAAARILAKLAGRHGTDVDLKQRIEYLSRATMSAKSSTLRTSSAAEGEFLHELEEKMEVARLQLQIFETLSVQVPPVPQEALSRLNSDLLDITTLYGEFADPCDLSESKLAIIHCAGHYDPTLVESLWQDIIEKELDIMKSKPAQTKMTTLGNKMVALGRLYAAADRYFPQAFLIKTLEIKSCEENFDVKFVYRTMQDIGLTLTKLQEIYDRLFKSKDPCWQAAKKPVHLLNVLCDLIGSFANSPTLVPAYERKQFVTICLDSVASYLVELHATSAMDIKIRQLASEFKAVQSKLERLQ